MREGQGYPCYQRDMMMMNISPLENDMYIQEIDNGYRKDFNMNGIHAEPPFLCNYTKSRNGCYDI